MQLQLSDSSHQITQVMNAMVDMEKEWSHNFVVSKTTLYIGTDADHRGSTSGVRIN